MHPAQQNQTMLFDLERLRIIRKGCGSPVANNIKVTPRSAAIESCVNFSIKATIGAIIFRGL